MNRVYLDSSPVIYLVQQVVPFWTAVRIRLSASSVVCVSSELTRMECLVLPLRNGDPINLVRNTGGGRVS